MGNGRTMMLTDQSTQLYSFIPSGKEGDSIVAKLADRFKNGSVVMDDGDGLTYLAIFVVTVVSFLLLYQIICKLFQAFGVKQYT